MALLFPFQGTVPSDLVGTLYRNGAGRIRVGASPALRYSHWFDGDGMVSAFTFTANGRCFFRQRYLQGKKFLAQKNAKEGAWGGRGVWTQRGGREGKWWENMGRIPDNPLNTNVLVLEGAKEGGTTRTLALCEGGLPFEFDPVSLAVRREPEDFGECWGSAGGADDIPRIYILTLRAGLDRRGYGSAEEVFRREQWKMREKDSEPRGLRMLCSAHV